MPPLARARCALLASALLVAGCRGTGNTPPAEPARVGPLGIVRDASAADPAARSGVAAAEEHFRATAPTMDSSLERKVA